jgi:predicted flavoprotein YhiN
MHLFHNKHTDIKQKENHSLEIDLMPHMYIHYTQCRILSKAPALNDLHKHTAGALMQKIVKFRPKYS